MKRHTLSSGIVLEYEHVAVPGRGGAFKTMFATRPTEADIAEALAFLNSLMPAGARTVIEAISHGPDAQSRSAHLADAFVAGLYGGSRN